MVRVRRGISVSQEAKTGARAQDGSRLNSRRRPPGLVLRAGLLRAPAVVPAKFSIEQDVRSCFRGQHSDNSFRVGLDRDVRSPRAWQRMERDGAFG